MPTHKQLKKNKQQSNRIPGGNELKPGTKRDQEPSQWDGVKTSPSFWARADITRHTLGQAWGIRKTGR